MTKKSRQQFTYLENKKLSKKGKVFVIIFKGLSLEQINQFFWKVRAQL